MKESDTSSSLEEAVKSNSANVSQFQNQGSIVTTPALAQEHYNNAIHYVGRGQLQEAIDSFKQALSIQPAAEVYFNLGTIQERDGKPEDAAASYKSAISLKPKFVQALFSLGNVAFRQENFDEAVACFQKVLSINPEYSDASVSLAVVHKKRGFLLEEAETRLQKVLSTNPSDPSAHNELGLVLVRQERFAEASTSFQQAVTLNPEFWQAHFNLGNEMFRKKNFAAAVACFQKALSINPEYSEAYSRLAIVHEKRGLLEEAEACLQKVLSIDYEESKAHNNLGAFLIKEGRLDEAITHLQQAVSLNPESYEAHFNIAVIYERKNLANKARQHLDKSIDHEGNNPDYLLLKAKLLYREKDFPRALEKLHLVERSVGNNHEALAGAYSLFGKIYDHIGEEDNAFAYFIKSNNVSARILEEEREYIDPSRCLNEVVQLKRKFAKDWLASWQNITDDGRGLKSPVFLMGFPRSGTTLLDQVLSTHQNIEVAEEKPIIPILKNRIDQFAAGFPDSLAHLDANNVHELQQEYFEIIKQFLPDNFEDKIIIDKFPLNIIQAGMVKRIFPDAKIILALRHPYDVCLSCFMQKFRLNDAMANFHTLASTARLYAAIMDLWQQYTNLLDIKYHVVKYENVVDNFESEIKGLLSFLSIPWDVELINYHKHVDKRRSIKTPSYQDISSPIFTRAKYRWKRYEKYFEDVEDILAPHVEYFGYTLD